MGAARSELRVGVFGAGQLGRMLGLAALRLGVDIRFLTDHDSGATRGIGETLVGRWDDEALLREFMTGCAVLTVENEWVDLSRARELAERELGVAIHPSPTSLGWIADKLIQKQRYVQHALACGPFRGVPAWADDPDAVRAIADELGYPLVAKRRRHSYDGYGNVTVREPAELGPACERLGPHEPVLLEAWVPFVRELAVLVARRADGEAVVYPVAYTEQQGHRCAAVEVPAPIDEQVAARAQALARAVVEAFELVGIAAVELFELADGTLWVNELAPRPHNSGHYTIEACQTSQFENHLRAVLGWPLGDPSLRTRAAVMVNVLGERSGVVDPRAIVPALALPGVAVHLYGKREVQPKRKMGHVTAIGDDLEQLRERAEQAAADIHL